VGFYAQTAGTDPLPLVGYGALGVIVMAAFFGLIWFKPAVERLLADKTKAEDQRDALLAVVTKEVQPALIANAAANEALKPVLQDVVRVLDQVHDDMRPRPPVPKRRTDA
jgi:hypothetical protein